MRSGRCERPHPSRGLFTTYASLATNSRSLGLSMFHRGYCLVTSLVTEFAALMVTQVSWGLGWTFTSGAEVARMNPV